MTIPEFKTAKERNNFLVKNSKEIINLKKSAIKHTDPFNIIKNGEVIKALTTNYSDDIESGIIKRTFIGNTYMYMDSQSDVLIDGCSAKSISEREKDIFHLSDHNYSLEGKVGKPSSIYEKAISWKDLGIDMLGKTQCLFMDSEVQKDYNSKIFNLYLKNEINQHSIGLNYVSLQLAINDPDYKEEYAVWLKYIDRIGNSSEVKDQGYFWAVTEIKLLEISCVLMGSNKLTPALVNESKMSELLSEHEKKSAQNIQPDDFYTNIVKHLNKNPLK